MRPIILHVATSIDCFIAREDGSFDWLFAPGEEDYGMREFYNFVDTVLIGRKTHDVMVANGMPAYTGLRNIVFTRDRNRDAGKGAVEYVTESVPSFIRGLKHQPGKAIWLCGGGELARELLQAGLVDEISLAVHPHLLGSGIPLFGNTVPETALTLIGHQVYPSGLVSLSYKLGAPQRESPVDTD